MKGKSIRSLTALLAVFASFAGVASLTGPSSALASFAIASYDNSVINQDGSPALQAGGHPYELSTNFTLATQTNLRTGLEAPEANAKDVAVELPPGFIGNPAATPKCLGFQVIRELASDCPHDTQIGVAELYVAFSGGPALLTATPVYNLQAPPNEPARFGFNVAGTMTVLDSNVRTGGDYGITTTIRNLPEFVDLVKSKVRLWGVPADPSHDKERCPFPHGPAGCDETFGFDGNDPHPSDSPPRPLLTNPTYCAEPLSSTLHIDSWEHPGVFAPASAPFAHPAGEDTPLSLTGCDLLAFEPAISVQPQSHSADSPTGLDVDLKVPQTETPGGLATPQLRKAVVTLPAGMAVNPAAADGLAACSQAQIALASAAAPSCPDASKIGSVEIDTPLLSAPLEGSVYLAAQGDNPFGSLLAMYVVAEGSGVLLKLPGRIDADPATGQLTTTFDNQPQQPFSELKLSLSGGPRAALVNPPACGTFTATSALTPWSSSTAATPSSSFDVTSGPGGGACPSPRPFSPTFTAGTTSNQASGFSPFVLSLTRQDGEQPLAGLSETLAPGLLAKIAGVPRCSDADAAAGSCPAESQIGMVTVGAGAGPDPFFLQGKIFLTGPYNGGPFGEVVVVHAVAGPLDLGNVVVRGSIRVDPHTAQATVVSDAFPQILQGIPVALRRVDVSLDRPGFTFNPTSCAPLSIPATVTSGLGASAGVSSRFQAADCASLAFHPGFSASTLAKTSRGSGASLHVHVSSGAGQANIHSVVVSLPKQLPSWLPTLRKACSDSVFDADPASCPAGSIVGSASAVTPVLASPLSGPAYLVSHGGAAFPDLVVVLQGEGVTLDLDGQTHIKGNVTTSTFDTVPDAPIDTFDLSLPQGPNHVLAAVLPAKANGSLCGQALTMPTTITGQNGAQIKQSTKIAVAGCTKAKKKHKRKHKAKKGSTKKGK
ncbi:MAG TPA: hypothetical protein VGI76_00835 [Solirubrobacteraceae bacterium]